LRFVIVTLIITLIAPLATAEESNGRAESTDTQESKGFWSSTLETLNNATPNVIGAKPERDTGWFSGAWDGTKRVWNEGKWDLYVSGYTIHLPYAYTQEEIEKENAWTYGLGVAKRVIDERDNEHSLYALMIKDSHYYWQYSAGYAWMARWRPMEHLRVGLGYSLFIMSRQDINNYIPFPGIAPLVSVGASRVDLFATFIPGEASIVYLFGRIGFD
jgi:palmitoyl transferase